MNTNKRKILFTLMGFGLLVLILSAYPKSEVKNIPLIESISAAPRSEAKPNSVLPLVTQTLKSSTRLDVVPNYKTTKNLNNYQTLQEDLSDFATIKAKVFVSDTEGEFRNKIIHDSHLLHQVGQYLKDVDSIKESQDAAVDFLIEAYQKGDRSVALETILDILHDTQVENKDLDHETRENMAGVKGELMYQISAMTPQLSQMIIGIISGPVTLAIWKNVQSKQNENYVESVIEKTAHQAALNQ